MARKAKRKGDTVNAAADRIASFLWASPFSWAIIPRVATKQTTEIKLDGLTIRHDVEENRVMLLFAEKPAPAIRALCKQHGFKWSPTRQANVRHLSNAAIYAAEVISKAFAAQQPAAESREEQGTE